MLATAVHDPLTRLLAQVIAIVVVSRLLAPLLRRVGQPMVVAEIVAGVLLGPSLLGRVVPGSAGALFGPDATGPLSVVSEFGLVLFMFVVGLELDLRLLRGQERRALVVASASVAVPFALGAALMPLLHPGGSSVAPWTYALFLGTATSASAFPVLSRIAAEHRLVGTPLGALALAVAAVDDAVFWCLAAVFVEVERSSSLGDVVWKAPVALACVVGFLVLVQPLLRRLGARVSNPESLGQGALAAVLVLVFLAGLATESLGLNALFGAFVVGVALPKEGGLAHAIASRIEDLVFVVLLPLFYAYSGARTDLGVLASPTDWIEGLAILVLAVGGKLGGTALAARATGLPWRASGALGALLNARGLKGLIVLHLGLELGVVDERLFTILVLVGIATTLLTSPLLRWLEPVPVPTGVDLVPGMDTAGTYRVLACVSSGRAGAGLATVAAAVGRGPLHALHLLEPEDRVSFALDRERQRTADPGLEPLLDRAEALGMKVRPVSFVSTEPSVDICRVADAKAVDLVLLGWHRPVVNQTLLGGTVYEVLRGARSSSVGVFVDRGLGRVSRVLVPWRGAPHDRAALGIARRIALQSGATISVLAILAADGPTEDEARATLDDALRDVARRRITVVRDLHDGPSPLDSVLAACVGHDLVVVGVGREWGLEQRFIGLQPERLMQACPVSLLVVRGSPQALAEAEAPRAVHTVDRTHRSRA